MGDLRDGMEDGTGIVAGHWEHTLKSSVQCTGIGLHTGNEISMTLRPAGPGTGIVFRRTDLGGAGGSEIPARWDRVADTHLCTRLRNEDGVEIGTIEHLMAALAGCGIDNAVVELDGPEVPIMDGSADPFVLLIESAGAIRQNKCREAIRILRPVVVRDGERMAMIEPADRFSIHLDIDFSSPCIRRQRLDLDFTPEAFKTEIGRARTFGFLDEVETLRKSGLALGGSLDNAVVLSGNRVLNKDGLRYPDEFVRHKALDCIGDLYLAGAPLLGRFIATRAGHAMNNRLLRKLFSDAEAWTRVSLREMEEGSLQGWAEPASIAATA